MVLKGVIFDMDGTLCLPQNYMFKEMRDALGISETGWDILEYIHSLPEHEQEEAQEKLRVIERRAMHKMIPQPGLTDLMDYLVSKQLKITILTRNFPIPVEYLRQNFLKDYPMSPIITREFKPPKPAPDAVFHICNQWGVSPEEVIVVGDSIDDMMAGHRAGSRTFLLRHPYNESLVGKPEVSEVIFALPQLIAHIERAT